MANRLHALHLFVLVHLLPTPGLSKTCDVFSSHSTPCVCAVSMVRALYDAYSGPLYQVQRVSDNATLDITVGSAGGFVDTRPQEAFCNASLVPPSTLPPLGTIVNLVPATMPLFGVRHCYSQAYVTPLAKKDNDFGFKLVAALNGAPGAVSFESVNYNTSFLAEVSTAEPGRLGIVPAPDPDDASWLASPAPGGGMFLTSTKSSTPPLAITLGPNLTGICAHEYSAPSADVVVSSSIPPVAFVLDGSAGGACVVSMIYDQSPEGNHLSVAPPGGQARFNLPVNAAAFPVRVGGGAVPAYGALFQGGQGYRRDNTTGVPTGDDPETIYLVTSNAVYNSACCFDSGQAETNNRDQGPGTMEAIYWGNVDASGAGWCGGVGHGPHIMSDMESGIWGCAERSGSNPLNVPMDFDFVTAMVKGDTGNHWAIKGGNANSTGGPLASLWDGPRPSGYEVMKKQGAVILGIGGDSSNGGIGVMLEFAITKGFTSDEADNAMQEDIMGVGYQRVW